MNRQPDGAVEVPGANLAAGAVSAEAMPWISSPLAVILAVAVVISAITLTMTVRNLARYRPAPTTARRPGSLAVCIPARNERANLRACVEGALAAAGEQVAVEVLVYDDESTDGTTEILAELVARDPRVRRVGTRPLPAGWNGKQHACDQIGRAAASEWLLFTDADVRFAPDSLAPAVALAESRGVALLSTFPRQETGTLGERLFVPMIAFILFSYLPMGRMRSTLDPAASAGCGQYLLVRREAWLACGGHEAFRGSMHDGIKLPRLLRRHGHATDLFDGTSLVSCRMYHGLAACWRGFAKNAYEGLGSVGLLVFITLLHLVGHVLPWVVLLGAVAVPGWREPWVLGLAAVAVLMHLAQRTLLAARFSQGITPVLIHPGGVLASIAVQWWSLWLHLAGTRSWRGRTAS